MRTRDPAPPPSDVNPEESSPSPFTRPGFLASAALLAAIVVMAIVVLTTGGGDDPAPDPVAAPAPAPTQDEPVSETDAGASTCGLPDGDPNVPVIAPPTDWRLVGTVAAPSNPDTFGPGLVDDGLPSCYQHSPVGALYAAANFIAATGTNDLRARAVDDLTAQGAGRNRALELVEEDPVIEEPGGAQIAGFSFINYSEDRALVDIAFSLGGGTARAPLALVWMDGDWLVDLPPTGDPYTAIESVPDLTGYVPWSGT